MKGYLIGVDIGTQGTKALLLDTDLNTVCSAFEPSRLISPEPGTVWQEAGDIFGSVARTIRQVLEQSGAAAGEVLAVGLDSQMAGIMGVDAAGEASTCYDSWLDTRCGPQLARMKERLGRRVTEITGGPVTYTHGPKILWWKENHPQAYEKTCKFVLPHGYVVGKMVGLSGEEAVFDYTCLQYSGFGDNLAKKWSGELLDAFEVDSSKMARICSPFEIVGGVNREFAALSGLAEGTPVAAGGGDTACSIFGSGMFQSGMLYDCAGTASVLCCVADEYSPDTRFETMTMMRSPVDGQWFPLAYINGGGLCLRWLRDELTGKPHADYDQLSAEAGEIAPGSEGLLLIPHFAGRVLPSNPYLKGTFLGLDWKHTRAHLFRAVMEGIAYEYGYYLSVLKALYPGTDFREMAAIGGGAKSPLFLQIKADVLGVDVTSFETGDTALIGSAVIAGVGAGVFADYRAPIEKLVKKRQTFQPDAAAHAAYAPYQSAYLKSMDALTGVYQDEVFGIH